MTVLRSIRASLALSSWVVVVAVGFAPRLAAAQPQPILPDSFVDDTLVTGLDEPNSMSFLPDGRLLFTELKNGRIRLLVGDHVAASDPVATVDGLNSDGSERGLQGIAVDPRWPSPPYVYVAYTHTGDRTWLVRYTASGDLDDPAGESLALGEPRVLLSDIRDLYENHNGLGLRFDPAGNLLLSLGEDSDACAAQRVDSLGGKLLRLDVSRIPAGGGGQVPRAWIIPPDHAFAGPDSTAMLVHAYGFRNPWRFHVDPATGTIGLADVGWNKFEEVNEVIAGANYGWPFLEGLVPGPPVSCTPAPGVTLVSPIVAWANIDDIAIMTAGFYRPVPGGANNWPAEFWGNLFYGDYYHSRLRRLRKTGGTWSAAPPVTGQPTADDFALGLYWPADFLVGPDGSLYWLKSWDNSFNPSSGMVRRIRYTGPPVGVGDEARAPALRAAPNPFRDRVSIALGPGGTEALDVAVFDVGGRMVRRLDIPNASGETRVVWDGRDDVGRPMPPGIYLVRLSRPDARATLRLLRVQ